MILGWYAAFVFMSGAAAFREVQELKFVGAQNLTWIQEKYSGTGNFNYSYGGYGSVGEYATLVVVDHETVLQYYTQQRPLSIEMSTHEEYNETDEQAAKDFCCGIDYEPSDHMLCSVTDYSPMKPKFLNFAVFGTMIFTIDHKQYECKDMRIGQMDLKKYMEDTSSQWAAWKAEVDRGQGIDGGDTHPGLLGKKGAKDYKQWPQALDGFKTGRKMGPDHISWWIGSQHCLDNRSQALRHLTCENCGLRFQTLNSRSSYDHFQVDVINRPPPDPDIEIADEELATRAATALATVMEGLQADRINSKRRWKEKHEAWAASVDKAKTMKDKIRAEMRTGRMAAAGLDAAQAVDIDIDWYHLAARPTQENHCTTNGALMLISGAGLAFFGMSWAMKRWYKANTSMANGYRLLE